MSSSSAAAAGALFGTSPQQSQQPVLGSSLPFYGSGASSSGLPAFPPLQGGGVSFVPSGVPLMTHTLVRVRSPPQSRQHPLAGLWKGVQVEGMWERGAGLPGNGTPSSLPLLLLLA